MIIAVRRVQNPTIMKTTVGKLVASLFNQYEHAFGDHHLAALATQQRVNAMLLRSAHDRGKSAGPSRSRR